MNVPGRSAAPIARAAAIARREAQPARPNSGHTVQKAIYAWLAGKPGPS
jgi:hypothetical protein